jgi:hypothetical protein
LQLTCSRNEARALAGLGRCTLAAARPPRPGVLLRQALKLLQRIAAAEADHVVRELTTPTEAGPPA